MIPCSFGCNTEHKFKLKNGKFCCSISPNSCSRVREKNSKSCKKLQKAFPKQIWDKDKKCKYCEKLLSLAGMFKHELNCHLNPTNLKLCAVCDKPIKKFRCNQTCSYGCSNKLFRSGENNGNWKESVYRTTCFLHHKKECVICGEKNIVTVHHLDENHENNVPENLVPLCPTHHQYWHSNYQILVKDKIMLYVEDFKKRFLL